MLRLATCVCARQAADVPTLLSPPPGTVGSSEGGKRGFAVAVASTMTRLDCASSCAGRRPRRMANFTCAVDGRDAVQAALALRSLDVQIILSLSSLT